jgi:7-cyano-7-deazaguanine synthase
VLLLSGGIDSTACARYLQEAGHSVRPVFVDFGQPAAREEGRAAEDVSRLMGLHLEKVRIAYTRTFDTGEIKGRNAFLVLAGMMSSAYCEPCFISIGVHAGTRYYDCTQGFVDAIDRLVSEYSDGRARVLAPFITWSKTDVFRYFSGLNIPLELTYSCEAGAVPPCDVCASCRDRRRFK